MQICYDEKEKIYTMQDKQLIYGDFSKKRY